MTALLLAALLSAQPDLAPPPPACFQGHEARCAELQGELTKLAARRTRRPSLLPAAGIGVSLVGFAVAANLPNYLDHPRNAQVAWTAGSALLFGLSGTFAVKNARLSWRLDQQIRERRAELGEVSAAEPPSRALVAGF